MFGTESDPATPWDPALQALRRAEDTIAETKGETERNPEYPPTATYATLAPDSEAYDWSSAQVNPYDFTGMFGAPTYPWGMPMSPVNAFEGGVFEQMISHIPGGPGVMWTPTGWAVQDAAMKMALLKMESGPGSAGKKLKAKNEFVPKTYWRS